MGQQRQRGSKHGYPESAHTIRDYATLKDIAKKFAAGEIKLLILLGGPGKGKGQIVRRAMQAQAPTSDDVFFQALSVSLDNILARLSPDSQPQHAAPNLGPGLYVKGGISPISFHIEAYRHRDAPICIDDADDFFADARLREQTKHLSETDQYKLMAHRTLAKELVAQGVPQEFWTTSPVCLIRNVWDSGDHTTDAIESRGTVIVFEPTWAEAYAYIGEWYWDQEIYDYLWEMLPLLREPDIRLMTKAYDLKVANIPGLPWRSVIDRHAADTAHILVAEYLRKDTRQFGSEEQRIEAWITAVKARDPEAAASRATWHRYKNKVEDLEFAAPRPNRIVLGRVSPPVEARPFDSPVVAGGPVGVDGGGEAGAA
jgi:hypothetical protein